MKKLLLDNVVANVRAQRLERASLQHIMNAYSEGIQALLLALNCDPAEITILSGAVATEDGSDYEVTAGWVAYADEIFEVDAASFTAGGGETGVWNIDETYLASDPVKFDDGNEFNANQIRKMVLESGVSGSGVKDWDDTSISPVEKITSVRPYETEELPIGDWDMDTDASVTVDASSIYPKVNNANIRNIQVMIISDDASYIKPLVSINGGSATVVDGAVDQVILNGSTQEIILSRTTGQDFDRPDFDSISYNRGTIYIEYLPD